MIKSTFRATRQHIYHHSSTSTGNFLLFLLLLIITPKRVFASPASSKFAPTCTAEPSLAYVHKGNNNQEPIKPLMRAWMCHGNTHKEMVGKLASVSETLCISVVGSFCYSKCRVYFMFDACILLFA